MFNSIKEEMKEYYFRYPMRNRFHEYAPDAIADLDIRNKIFEEMDDFYSKNPYISSSLLKSRIHTLMAEYCNPKIFRGNPFFFEIGCRDRDCWGIGNYSPAFWMIDRLQAKVREENSHCRELEEKFLRIFSISDTGLCDVYPSFDRDHHTLGYTTLFEKGINGILEEIRVKKEDFSPKSEEFIFLISAEESCNAVLKIAERFSKSAEEMLKTATSNKERESLILIRDTAKKIPASKPETFYEGLCMLLFTREVTATFENLGISHLGHVDRLLGSLYEKDIKSGAITEERARELVKIWMMHTDIRFDMEHNPWPETSTCLQLGGCDREGIPIFNDVTRIFVEEHLKAGFVNPKLNCRYSKNSPEEYLELIGSAILKGHNNFVLINDDIVIGGLINNGVDERDARMYVNGGCQETMIEGFGHTEGAAFYVSMPKILDLFLREGNTDIIKPIQSAENFEDFYNQFKTTSNEFLSRIIEQRNIRQYYHKHSMVCPFFSATQNGCIENGKDYVLGGAKYNFSTIALVGFGTVVDSLLAVKELVYEQKCVTLNELIAALNNNWESYEELRQKAVKSPKYGCGKTEADLFAKDFLAQLAGHINQIKNERGGNHIPSLFVYYFFHYFSGALRATPDGRKDRDRLSMGCSASQLNIIKDITAPINSMNIMDYTVCRGGSAVLDVKLPMSNKLTPELFSAFMYGCAKLKCPTLQPNVVSPEALIDAKIHPEKHKDLVVRISGLSAYFITLEPHIQDEIIARNIYNV